MAEALSTAEARVADAVDCEWMVESIQRLVAIESWNGQEAPAQELKANAVIRNRRLLIRAVKAAGVPLCGKTGFGIRLCHRVFLRVLYRYTWLRRERRHFFCFIYINVPVFRRDLLTKLNGAT